MELILSSENVVDFLKQQKLCSLDFQPAAPIACQSGTNFNLVVKSNSGHHFLVKQNRVDAHGETWGSLPAEWLVQTLIDDFELSVIQPLVSQVLLLDWSNYILVSVFYDNYLALDRFYETRMSFNPQIPRILGANLAQVHSATYQQQQQREFFGRYFDLDKMSKTPGFIQRLNNLNPNLFGAICPDGLDFYKLYQRFPSLNLAVLELYEHIQPTCLIHNDLTLNNFIIDEQIDFDLDSDRVKPEQLKIIDWERIIWGDPAVDLGMVVSQYLAIWLNSLVPDSNLELNTILRLAAFPLETITPSLKSLLQEYLSHFPSILQHRPDFIRRVVQFAGIGILDRLSYSVEHHYHFHNRSLCQLQVAKNLLCHPQQGIETIFDSTEAELINYPSLAA